MKPPFLFTILLLLSAGAMGQTFPSSHLLNRGITYSTHGHVPIYEQDKYGYWILQPDTTECYFLKMPSITIEDESLPITPQWYHGYSVKKSDTSYYLYLNGRRVKEQVLFSVPKKP